MDSTSRTRERSGSLPGARGDVDQAALDLFSGKPLLIGVRALLQARRLPKEVAKAVNSVWLHSRVPEFYLKVGRVLTLRLILIAD